MKNFRARLSLSEVDVEQATWDRKGYPEHLRIKRTINLMAHHMQQAYGLARKDMTWVVSPRMAAAMYASQEIRQYFRLGPMEARRSLGLGRNRDHGLPDEVYGYHLEVRDGAPEDHFILEAPMPEALLTKTPLDR